MSLLEDSCEMMSVDGGESSYGGAAAGVGGAGADDSSTIETESPSRIAEKEWWSACDRGQATVYRYCTAVTRPRKNAPNKTRTFRKKVPVVVYATPYTPGSAIRDAASGAIYRALRVGTNDENLFFKVALATGELTKVTTNHLYFGSPGEYEAHMYAVCSDATRARWLAKYNEESDSRRPAATEFFVR
jgi:hypothetical protein